MSKPVLSEVALGAPLDDDGILAHQRHAVKNKGRQSNYGFRLPLESFV
jgi:hypothetical protein